MDINKTIKLLRLRNEVLQNKIDENKTSTEKAKLLLSKLQSLDGEWEKELKELKKQREEYSLLIEDLKIIKHELTKTR